MNSIRDEIKQVQEAKDNRLRNTLTDLTALASTYYDPTGISASVIRSTKPKNKYSCRSCYEPTKYDTETSRN